MEKEKNERSRKWLITINNPADHAFTHEAIRLILENWKGLRYWCMCDEIGGHTQTYHTHLFIWGKNPIYFSNVKDKFKVAHIDKCKGSAQDNYDYIRKEGKYTGTEKETTNLRNTFEESGELPHENQGERNDLYAPYDMIKSGMDNYDILEENPHYMAHLDKVERCRQILKEKEYRNIFRKMENQYWFGKTGAGKTRTVMERYGYGNVYRVTDYQHPFDGYSGQDVIVFEEFNGNIPFSQMLTLLDGYPLELPCRYNNKIACYTKVFILSNLPLEKQYPNIQENSKESWLAFLRRIDDVVEYGDKGVIGYDKPLDYMYSLRNKFMEVDEQVELPFD